MKTIAILTEKGDRSTAEVMDYLAYRRQTAILRLNYETLVRHLHLELGPAANQATLNEAPVPIDLDAIDGFWYRRGNLHLSLPFGREAIRHDRVKMHLDTEWMAVQQLVQEAFGARVKLGSAQAETEGRKLKDLFLAQKAGFAVPDTLVTTDKNKLTHFVQAYPSVITKPLNYHVNIETTDVFFKSTGTRIIASADLDLLDDHFFPLFAQAYIDKKIEIRIFFLKNQLFPMAIFSQQDDTTRLDYRHYNTEKPNRNVPFALPEAVVQCVLRFIEYTQLDTGSIDVMLGQDGVYYFLEVNPCGQFSWVSLHCNYYLEERIAQYLTDEQPAA